MKKQRCLKIRFGFDFFIGDDPTPERIALVKKLKSFHAVFDQREVFADPCFQQDVVDALELMANIVRRVRACKNDREDLEDDSDIPF